jgi:pimeloyl-ACP methyl ester carboxylesterase
VPETRDKLLTQLFDGQVTRRRLIAGLIATLAPGHGRGWAAQPASGANGDIGPLTASVLPQGIRSRFVAGVNGLRVHILEAGYEAAGRPAVLLVHGYPELAYSWRKVMGPLAAAGYHVFAPDVRGYGRTSPAPVSYSDDLRPYNTINRIKDMVALVSAMGYRSVAAVIGHDQGSPLAGWCALTRPDVFRSVVMMSAPFGGPPALPFNTANVPPAAPPAASADTIYDELARLTPPRQHYQRYYQTAEANENMWHAAQGIHDFLRAYYHVKSADWKENRPHPLAGRTATEWAKLPRYYVMDLHKGMAEQVASEMPSASEIAANGWLPDAELRVYSEEYGRTGFQGGLNGYRNRPGDTDLQLFAGRTIDVPSSFMGGKSDWGVYQNPGALDRLEKTLTTKYQGTHLLDGAGHWVQQEQAIALSALLVAFLKRNA